MVVMNEKINLLYIGSNKRVMNSLFEHSRISMSSITGSDDVNFLNSVTKADVILCERFLPGHDGFIVYHIIREFGSINQVPFILIASDHSEGLITSGKKLGIDDIYVLPLPPVNDLVSRIEFLREYRKTIQFEPNKYYLPENHGIPISKRLFDIVIAASALMVLSPVLLIVMIAIRMESKGKVYYTSTRIGRRPFDFYKFRSMRTGAENELNKLASEKNQYISHQPQNEADWKSPCPCSMKQNYTHCSPILHGSNYSVCDTWYVTQKRNSEKSKPNFIKIADDPRVTRVGKIIRNTSIDELPQLINVIKGDMSIVGNRPLPVYEAEKLTSDIMAKRFLAPAGLTGLWQVEKRGRKGRMSDEERKNLDNQYAELFIKNKYSFFYDLKLILKTIPVIIQKESV